MQKRTRLQTLFAAFVLLAQLVACIAPSRTLVPIGAPPGVVQPRTNVSSAFNPATLSLTGWWRAAYAGAPWSGVASAGASGGRNLTTTGSDPAVGATLNGLAGADFNGSANTLTTGLAGTSFFTTSAMSGWALVRADTSIADPGVGSRWTGNAIIGDSGATYLQVTFTAAGASLYLTASGAGYEVTAACSTGANHLVQWKYDGNAVKMRCDSAAWQSVTATSTTIDDLSSTIVVGFQQAYWDGRIWELAFTNTVPSDGTFDNIKTYVNTRYALAL